jgi:hypothetical protein
MQSFNTLSEGVIIKILTKVSPRTCIAVLLLSRRYQRFYNDKHFWKNMIITDVSDDPIPDEGTIECYRETYGILKKNKILSGEVSYIQDIKSDSEYLENKNKIFETQKQIEELSKKLAEYEAINEKIIDENQDLYNLQKRTAEEFFELLISNETPMPGNIGLLLSFNRRDPALKKWLETNIFEVVEKSKEHCLTADQLNTLFPDFPKNKKLHEGTIIGLYPYDNRMHPQVILYTLYKDGKFYFKPLDKSERKEINKKYPSIPPSTDFLQKKYPGISYDDIGESYRNVL